MGVTSVLKVSDRESDCRSCYCVLSMCRLLNLNRGELLDGVGEYLLR